MTTSPRPRTTTALALVGLLLALPAMARAEERPAETLTLEQCVALALAHNPTLTIEKERLHETEADYLVTRSGLLPKLSASAYYNRLDPDRLSPAGVGLPGVTLFAGEAFANLRLRQLVFDGKTWPARTASALGVEAQRAGVASAKAETTFAVTLAYTRLVEAGNLVTVAKEGLKRQAAFVELTTGFFKVGKISRLDLLKAESQHMDAERALVAARENESLAQVLLRRAIGVGLDRPIRTTGELRRGLDAPPTEDAVLAEAVKRNPQLRKLSTQVRQADAARRAAWGEHLPELSLQASYGLRYRDTDGSADEYTVGAFLEVPLFSGGAIDGQVKRLKARRRQVEATRGAFEDQLRVDIREALTSWRIAVASAQFATKSVEVNREALAAATSLYESGKATALEVLTSQNDLVRAEATLVQALGDYAIARAKVARVTGNGTLSMEDR